MVVMLLKLPKESAISCHTNSECADVESRLVVAEGERGRRGMDWESGISRCKLLYRGWINSNVLLYTQGTMFNIV